MRSIEPLDLLDKSHRALFFDLIMENQDKFLNDHLNDPVFIIQECTRLFGGNGGQGFVLMVDGAQAGMCWLEIDLYGIGYIHGAIFPQYRNLFNAVWFLRQILDYCFGLGGLRKLVSEVPTHNKAAEAVLRKVGFTKEGILKDAFTVNGKPQKLLILGLTKSQHEGNHAHGLVIQKDSEAA